MLMPKPEDGYNASLIFELDKLPDDFTPLIEKAAVLKRNCFVSVFEKYFKFQEQGVESKERAIINYRDDETMYVEAKADRVTVIFSTLFKDPDDIVIGKLFLQVSIMFTVLTPHSRNFAKAGRPVKLLLRLFIRQASLHSS